MIRAGRSRRAGPQLIYYTIYKPQPESATVCTRTATFKGQQPAGLPSREPPYLNCTAPRWPWPRILPQNHDDIRRLAILHDMLELNQPVDDSDKRSMIPATCGDVHLHSSCAMKSSAVSSGTSLREAARFEQSPSRPGRTNLLPPYSEWLPESLGALRCHW